MGFTPINRITIVRLFEPRVIVVLWYDEVTGKVQEKRFKFDEVDFAFSFALSEFKSLAM